MPPGDALFASPTPSLGPDLTRWTSRDITASTPPLPPILSPRIAQAAKTHKGVLKHGETLSYERLEWLGDAYVEQAATILIFNTFSGLTEGECSQLRELCVKNETLSGFSKRYGLARDAVLPREFHPEGGQEAGGDKKAARKLHGDLLEAHVGAVVLANPMGGFAQVLAWLKALWAPLLSKYIHAEENRQRRLQAASESRLRQPDGTPSANGGASSAAPGSAESLGQDPTARPEEAQNGASVVASAPPRSAKETLATMLNYRDTKLQYNKVGTVPDRENHRQIMYKVDVVLDGWGAKNEVLGRGIGRSVKDGGMRAAENALVRNRKQVERYAAVRREFLQSLKATDGDDG